MKKINNWSVVVEWGFDDDTCETETISSIPGGVADVIDDWLTEYEKKNGED